MRRILVIVLMVIMVIGFEKQNLIYGSETTKNNIFDEEESTIAKYAESFLSKVYPDLTLKIVKSQKIYNRNDELNGYCYDSIKRVTYHFGIYTSAWGVCLSD